MERQRAVHTLDLFKDENSRILILGSFPSIQSRGQNFYYMNKTNRFYQVLSALYGEDFYSVSVERKKELLRKHRIALFDVVTECEISLSSDSSLKPIAYLNLSEVIKDTKIERIFINGNKAYALFVRRYPDVKVGKRPSTSSANARMRLDDLVREWKAILG